MGGPEPAEGQSASATAENSPITIGAQSLRPETVRARQRRFNRIVASKGTQLHLIGGAGNAIETTSSPVDQ